MSFEAFEFESFITTAVNLTVDESNESYNF